MWQEHEQLLELFPEWKGLHAFAMMKSEVTKCDTKTTDTQCYITLLTDVKGVSKGASDHWGVESSLHWCLDMTFHEDMFCIHKDRSAENMAVIRHIALAILKNINDKMSVARRRRYCVYDDDYLTSVILFIRA